MQKIFHTLLLLLIPNLLWAVQGSIATLENLSGRVDVAVKDRQRFESAEVGQLLYVGDRIQVGANGKGTIVFRDGSEIRLFENTHFVVEHASELPTEKRTFRYKLLMKAGKLWGRFVKGRQETEIQSTTATIGVKGTALRFSDDGKQARVALTNGHLTVANQTSSIELGPGKQTAPFSKTDALEDKIQDIPKRLLLRAESTYVQFDNEEKATILVSIQMVDLITKQSVKRAGKLYLRSDYYNVIFPEEVSLNHMGYARIPITIKTPRLKDSTFDGKVVVWAIMDDPAFYDVGDGTILFHVQSHNRPRKIKIDAR